MSSEYTSPWAGASILTVADHDDYRLQGKITEERNFANEFQLKFYH
jgi:hypothetical protein